MAEIKYVDAKTDDRGYTTYKCPYCGQVVLISDNTAPFDVPDTCGGCGKDLFFMGNDLEDNDD